MKIAQNPQVDTRRSVEFAQQESPIIRSNRFKNWLRFRVIWNMIWIALTRLRNPRKIIFLIKDMRQKYQQVNDEPMLNKVAKVGDRYFWRLSIAGFPSKANDEVVEHEINRIMPFRERRGLRTLLFGITKKCPLECEHCFEWPNLNQKETLSADDLIRVVRKYQDYGITQILFGGGEPMVRIKDIYKVLEAAGKGTDFWIYTSGFGFTADHATKLKALGLTGVIISIDHHDPKSHDRFRGYSGAFNGAIEAALAAKEAGLTVALSLCATPEYVSERNISSYLELGRSLGATFVQFVEARSTGRYAGKRVHISPEQRTLLEEAYRKYNHLPEYWDYPIIDYPDQMRRRIGCVAGGNRFFYIDTDGDAHACPFCSTKVCSALELEPEETVKQLQQKGCHIVDRLPVV